MADTLKQPQITYGRLNEALATLGFVRQKTEEFTAYRESTHDALIVLPNMSADSAVGAPHLVTIRNTVAGKGIASLEKLQALLVDSQVEHTASEFRARASKRHHAFVKPRKPGSTVRSQQAAQVDRPFTKSSVKKRSAPASGG